MTCYFLLQHNSTDVWYSSIVVRVNSLLLYLITHEQQFHQNSLKLIPTNYHYVVHLTFGQHYAAATGLNTQGRLGL